MNIFIQEFYKYILEILKNIPTRQISIKIPSQKACEIYF